VNWKVTSLVNAFKSPHLTLGPLDPDAAATLITAASDIALIVDAKGIVRDLAFSSERLALDLEGSESWLGKRWVDLVSPDSTNKVEALLRIGKPGAAPPRWRHLNHPARNGGHVPVLYSSVQVAETGLIVAFGRDLSDISDLQQRLVDAQQSMERDYARLRHVETRYRLLFEMTSEAVLVIDAASLKLIEANPAARELFGENWKRSLQRSLREAFDSESQEKLHTLLAGIRAAGRAETIEARLADNGREVLVSGSMFRQEGTSMFLIRLSPMTDNQPVAMPEARAQLLKLIDNAPDGFVVVGAESRIVAANAAFCDMIQLGTEAQARDERLDRWLGRPGVDMDVLLANLRQRGSVRLFQTILRGEFGDVVDVEISAVTLINGGQPCFGFAIRNIGRRPQAAPAANTLPKELPRSVEQLTELVGRIALKDLVREATDVIEKLCIEAALELTGDNRASAAEMLGLSRQSLYVKLRRYGLGDLTEEPNA
jgi:transcriptional regulator PpsR